MALHWSYFQSQWSSLNCKFYLNYFAHLKPHQTLFYFKHPILGRSYSTNLNRESRFMKKILSRSLPKKSFKIFGNDMIQDCFPSNNFKRPSNMRRVSVLNKVFMQHITDLVMTGNLIEDGFQITRIEIAPDFSNLNVFWTSKTSIEGIETILKDVARQIRHELSQLRVIGNVPKLIFHKDTWKDKSNKIEFLIKEVSKEPQIEDMVKYGDAPEKIQMVTNVYGLEHDKIMKKLGYKYSEYKIKKSSKGDPKISQ